MKLKRHGPYVPTGDYKVGKGRPPREHCFKKGHVANPTGINLNKERVALARMTKDELIDIANAIVKGSIQDLKIMAKNPESSAIKVMVAALVVRVIERGDTVAFNNLMDRLVGPVKQKVEFTGNAIGPQVIVHLPSNGYEADIAPIETTGKEIKSV